MGKKAKKKRAELGTAAAVGALLSQPIVKDLVVKAVVAGVTSAGRSARVRELARRLRGRSGRG